MTLYIQLCFTKIEIFFWTSNLQESGHFRMKFLDPSLLLTVLWADRQRQIFFNALSETAAMLSLVLNLLKILNYSLSYTTMTQLYIIIDSNNNSFLFIYLFVLSEDKCICFVFICIVMCPILVTTESCIYADDQDIQNIKHIFRSFIFSSCLQNVNKIKLRATKERI